MCLVELATKYHALRTKGYNKVHFEGKVRLVAHIDLVPVLDSANGDILGEVSLMKRMSVQ